MSKKMIAKKIISSEVLSDGKQTYILRLYVTGMTPNSSRAIINIKAICEKYLKNRHELEIIDIYQQPELAIAEKLIALPVLIKKFPLPEERMIGDLSDIDEVLKGLALFN